MEQTNAVNETVLRTEESPITQLTGIPVGYVHDDFVESKPVS